MCETTRIGTNLENLSRAAEKIGFRTLGVQLSLDEIKQAPLPCMLHWSQDHFVVLYKIHKNTFYISDPARGLVSYSQEEFLAYWIGKEATPKTKQGIALLIEITQDLIRKKYKVIKVSYHFLFSLGI